MTDIIPDLPPRIGRPPKDVDADQVAKLAKKQWSYRSIAAFFDVSEDTIKRRFADLIQQNYAAGQAILLDMGWEAIQKGDRRMLIKFLERFCDFKPGVVMSPVQINVNTSDEKIQAQAQYIDTILQELKNIQEPAQLPKGLIGE